MRLPPLPTIKDILRIYKIRALKQLSQNFLLNERIRRRFVGHAGRLRGHHVVEVGPGPGCITRSILRSDISHLTVVEKDSRFLPTLQLLKDVSEVPIDIVHGDILRYDITRNLPEHLIRPWHDEPPSISLMGNLPFSVATPLIIQYLKQISEKSGPWSYGRVKMTLTFQKEVGERMVAPVNGAQRSRLSIMTQYLCDVKYKETIPGKAFLPKPDVDVAVMHLVPKIEPLIPGVPFEVVEKAVSLIFHHRNKIFKNCVSTFFPPSRADLTEELGQRSGIDIDTVPAAISMEQFAQFCGIYSELCSREPGMFEYNYRSRQAVSEWKKRKAVWKDIHGDDYYYTDEDELANYMEIKKKYLHDQDYQAEER